MIIPERRFDDRYLAFKNNLVAMAFCADLLAVRFVLGLGALLVGLGFLWPSAVFPDPASIDPGARVTYLYMAGIAPEWAWGAAFTFQGGVMMWSLLAGRRSRGFLWFDAVLGCFLWTIAVLSCYAVYWIGFDQILDYKGPFIMGGELALVCASWWVLVRYNFLDERGQCGVR